MARVERGRIGLMQLLVHVADIAQHAGEHGIGVAALGHGIGSAQVE